uniref:EOG090X0289 n=1 Tax=Daphnia hispanica TaxID=575233 RepID=A0A4Y7M4Y3_9CRUS|nr:EOG090X0289 [Daphnia hispanica]
MTDLKTDVLFSNGHRMPLIGLGTWQAPDEEVKTAVQWALETGYRHIDTAFNYQNEGAIGEVIDEWIKSGKVKREDLFVTTKLPLIGNSPDKVEKFIKLSLESLKLDYVDLYLIHFPVGFLPGKDDTDLFPRDEEGKAKIDMTTDIISLWKAMEAQVDAGRAKSIGLSNFNSEQIDRIVQSSRIKPANLQVELHAYFQQTLLRATCAKHGITVCAYGPLGSKGRIELNAKRGLPAPEIPGVLEDPVVLEIANKHSKTPAQILLRHLIQEDVVVIPKSVSKSRIQENFGVMWTLISLKFDVFSNVSLNFQAFDFVLSESEISLLDGLDRNDRTFDFKFLAELKMDSALNDKRFANIGKDPRFRRVPASARKVVVDKRFNAMFNDRQFKLKYTVDKRGKPTNLTSTEQLKDFYEIESEGSGDENNGDADEEDLNSEEENEIESKDHQNHGKASKSITPILKNNTKIVNGFQVADLHDNVDEPILELNDAVKAKLQDLNVDYARGEGVLFSGSSSSEEDSEEEENDQEVIHDWGELDKDAEETDTATFRLAICHMDWDRIKAVDLMVVLQSFSPQGGSVRNVTIFPSEYGLQRMKEEEVLGPKELVEMKQEASTSKEDKDETGEVDDYHREKLRQYQINRLKYYYAVAECDSVETANKIYEECDGQEFESSAARLDLRFIPDDMVFDEKPHDVCNSMPDVSQYEPQIFLTSALQQAEVHLTWDETDPSRMQTMQKLFKGKNGKAKLDVYDERIKNFLATSSEDEDEDENPVKNFIDDEEVDGTESCIGESERISKYRNLLATIAQSEEVAKKNKGDVEMEISWGVGLQAKAEEMVKKKMADKALETPWEQQLAKRREKRKAQKQEKKKIEVAPPSDDEEGSDDVPSDIDMNDPYFKEEFEKEEFRKKKPNSKSKKVEETSHSADEANKAAELELLLMDDNDGKRHFNLKSILKDEKQSGKKGTKKTNEAAKTKSDDFKIQVDDPRFSALFTSHHFNLDPSDTNFKKTEAMETILLEKQKRRKSEPNAEVTNHLDQGEAKKSKMDTELSRLVRSVKIKTSMQKNQKKFQCARQ